MRIDKINPIGDTTTPIKAPKYLKRKKPPKNTSTTTLNTLLIFGLIIGSFSVYQNINRLMKK